MDIKHILKKKGAEKSTEEGGESLDIEHIFTERGSEKTTKRMGKEFEY